MSLSSRINKVTGAFELAIIVVLQLLVVMTILVSTIVLFILAVNNMRAQVGQVTNVPELLLVVQRAISGVLTVVLGLEVLETLKAYFRYHHVRLEVILVVAIIASGRHLVQVDFEHTSALGLLGLSAVIVSLTIGYYLVKKAIYEFPSKLPDVPKDE